MVSLIHAGEEAQETCRSLSLAGVARSEVAKRFSKSRLNSSQPGGAVARKRLSRRSGKTSEWVYSLRATCH
jgi:hypothetical protein